MSYHWAVNIEDSARATCCDMAELTDFEAAEFSDRDESAAMRGFLVAVPLSMALWAALAVVIFA